ncbi:nicotinamide N-methylase [Phyllobacterium brassicacearum]|uniref:Nicotinamide N-methylase n=1 Tax=Phyllobacterium brassicacearum TaxID=314235 RepID=A0A2P7BJI1_9HYPH|nr:methyltransferase [Phyllobacterium brassicacearum]PSH66585.1 nicotinamide N-methylase [Phyllobacterium brassicacearum]TDQ23677.1 putative nicotinamide N-methyase [Phyllobacterium brassicacearum]
MDEAALDPDTDRYRRFVLANTVLQSPPHVPEIALYLADEAHDLWHRTEEELTTLGLPPPFWAFAWAGGQGVARYVLDNPVTVANAAVLDFASGSGLVGIAATKSGAARTIACDIDPFARPAIALNANANQVTLEVSIENLIGSDGGWDVVLAGDVFYDKTLADQLLPWFTRLAKRGASIIIGDPGRSYLPKDILEPLAVYSVPVTRALEDTEVKRTTVWRFKP